MSIIRRFSLLIIFIITFSDDIRGREKLTKNIIIDNINASVLDSGEKIARHMQTAQNYSVRGWNHAGDALIFSRNGNLYQARGFNGRFTKIADFKKVSISGAKKAKVCGRSGFVFTADKDNDEYSQVFAGTKGQFEPYKLSKTVSRNIALKVSNDLEKVAYASAQKKTGVWRLYVQTICENGKLVELVSGENPVYPQEFHPQDNFLLTSSPTKLGYKLSEWDLKTGKEKVLLESASRIGSPRYAKDGKHVFFVSNENTEFDALYRLGRESQEVLLILSDLGVDIDFIQMSDDRSKMAINLNQLGLSKILILDAVELKLLSGPSKKSLGVVDSIYFSPTGDKLAIRLSQPTVPSRSGIYDYKKDRFRAWSGGFKRNQKITNVVPKVTSYPTFDQYNGQQRKIPLLVYKPESASAKHPVPVIIVAHGGPASQARPSFNRTYHYYVSQLDVAVLRPNIRGSIGYGKTFEQLDQTFRRQDSVKDIGALLDWIDEQADLDSSRVIISGGSYGGYISLASIVDYSDRLLGAISRVGISDFETFLKNTEPYRVNNRRKEYGDERSLEMRRYFEKISPLKNVHKIKKPVLIIQGAKDPRVPEQQANDMVEAIKANDVEVSYLLAKNEGHQFSKKKSRLARDGAQLEFIRALFFDD